MWLRVFLCVFFFQAEDGIRDLVRSRGLGDVYKRQRLEEAAQAGGRFGVAVEERQVPPPSTKEETQLDLCLLYTSAAADERSSVDLGGRRIINKKNKLIL